jgi:hypothetical protein
MILSPQGSAEAIAAAKRSLENYGRFWFGNLKVESDFYDLGLVTEQERYMAVDIALQEIGPHDRSGPEPPNNVSSGPPFHKRYLYAFCWKSKEFAKLMYFKFAVIPGSGKSRLAVYSFHESKS